MPAKVTKAFGPELAAMTEAVGIKPNYQLGNRRFAGGFLPQREPNREIMMSQSDQIERLAAKINDKKVFVYEQDISRTQRNVQRINVAGDL